MGHSAPGIITRFHEFSVLIESIPDHIMLPRREGAARNEITHPLAFLVFDDDACLTFLRLREAQVNLLLTRRPRLAIRRQIKLRPRSRIVIEWRVQSLVIAEAETLLLSFVLERDSDVQFLQIPFRQRYARRIGDHGFSPIQDADAYLPGRRLHEHRAIRDFDFHRNPARTLREQFGGLRCLCEFQLHQPLFAHFMDDHPRALDCDMRWRFEARVAHRSCVQRVIDRDLSRLRIADDEPFAVAVDVNPAAVLRETLHFLPAAFEDHDRIRVRREQLVFKPRQARACLQPRQRDGLRRAALLTAFVHRNLKGRAIRGRHYHRAIHPGRAADVLWHTEVLHVRRFLMRKSVFIDDGPTGKLHIAVVLFQHAQRLSTEHDGLRADRWLQVAKCVRRVRLILPAPASARGPDVPIRVQR